jgi:hypothetical protein
MPDTNLDDFSFEEDTHTYRNKEGIVKPSVTQVLKSAGVFDYSRVPVDILERKRVIGSNVHKWTEYYDRDGFIDETWIADTEQGYFEAWLKFRKESGFVIKGIEHRTLAPIAGMEVGGTYDRYGFFGQYPYLLDIKTCTAKHPGWALQLALYEMLQTGKARCGHMGRGVVQLLPTGKYKLHHYEDPRDADVAISALALSNWKHNNNLAA